MKKLILILTILATSTAAFAASPTINNVTGTVAGGQILNITGADMVQDNTSTWDDFFRIYPNSYGFEGTRATDGYSELGPSGGVYVSDVKVMGSKSIKFHSQGAWPAGPGGLGNYAAVNPRSTKGDVGEIWVRFYVRYNLLGGAWPTNYMKLIDTQGGPVNQYYLDVAGTASGQPKQLNATYDGAAHNVNIPGGALVNNRWYTVEINWKSSLPRSYKLWVDGVQILNATPSLNSTVDCILFGIINLAGTTSAFSVDTWIDGLAFGPSRIYPASTIEISGDGTTWKSQEPVFLSDTSSQIKVDLNGVTGTNYRLRVTNNQQQTSTIYTLSGSGGGGGGDIIAPTTPSSLTASAVSSSQINLSWPASTDNTAVTGYKIYRNGTYLATSTGTSYTNTGLAASTSYSYKVSAIDAAGNESGQSATATATTQAPPDTTAPSIPSGLAASATSSSQINLSWTASTDNVGVTGYKVYRNGTYLATSTGTSYTNTGLTASTSYSYRVSAIDAAGNESSQSTTVSATTQAGGTTGGTVLFQESFDNSSFSTRGWYDNTTHGTVVAGGQSGNSLQWAWAQGATKPTNGGSMRKKFTPTESLYVSFYVKFQSGWRGSQKTYHPHMILIPSDLDSDYAPLANNYLNTYVEFLSDIGSPYTIRPQLAIQDAMRVNAANGTPPNNLTAVTENRSVAYCNTPAPAGATGICYAASPYYSANSWKASTASVSTNAWHHVEVYFKMNTISGGKGQSNGIMQQWIDGALVIDRSNILYRTNQDATKKWAQFVLAPWIGDGSPIAQTMWLDELTVATSAPSSGGGDTQAPTIPANLSASATSSSQINLSWAASTDNTAVTGYKIYRSGTYLATSTGTSYTNTGLTASTSYSYKVSAIDAAGNESGQSATATATTQAPPDTTAPSIPSGLAASATSSSQINLSWTASTDNVGVTGYKIYRSGTYLATSTGTSYTNTGLTASTSYSYKVSAIDAAGNESGQSATASATTQAGGTTGTVLFQESFDNSSFSSRGWYDNTTHGTVVAGGQSGNSLQWAWAQGATKPTNGGSMRKKFTPTDSLYVSFYVKFQSGWRGSQKTYHPHLILIPSNLDSDYAALANNYLNTYIEFQSDIGSPYAIKPQLAVQDQMRVNTANGTPPNNLTAVTENRSVAYCNTPVPKDATGSCYAAGPYYSANTWKASTASVATNDWHHVEVYFKMNTVSNGKSQSNGVMQQWLDGSLVINRSDVLYRTSQDATKKWAQFVLAPWIGDGSPIAQTMWLDELTVTTSSPYSVPLSVPTGFMIRPELQK